MTEPKEIKAVIKTGRLRKEYEHVVALSALDLAIPECEICGLIGPNGAGKSTLLKILSTVIRPDFGMASVYGYGVEAEPLEVRKRIGFMPDFFALYENVTCEDFLTYFGLAYGLAPEKINARVTELLELVRLTEKRKEFISSLSRGMRQRLVFAKTLVHDPPALLLDEPLSGLDPKARMEMREALRNLKSLGKTIIISSHILTELSEFCTYVVIMEKGLLKASGRVDEILARMRGEKAVTLEVTGLTEKARQIISSTPGVTLSSVEGLVIKFGLAGDKSALADINAALVRAGIGVVGLREEQGNIEDIYKKISGNEVQ
jgi:ABC-2 type transport system ATP-binding protein